VVIDHVQYISEGSIPSPAALLLLNIQHHMSRKLNVTLGMSEHLAAPFKAMIKDFTEFHSKKQGAFKGEKKTYTPAEGTADEPSKRGVVRIQTTVPERLEWLTEKSTDYIDTLFSVEKTNASGKAIANLIVDGENLGEYSTLELLRLKNILEEIRPVYETIPVYSDAEIWVDNTDALYQNRQGVMMSPISSGEVKTTEKTQYILEDPNVQHLKDTSKYVAQVSSKDTVRKLGDYTFQKFTGEWSHRERAEVLDRRSRLYNAVVEAIKIANEVEVVKSGMTAHKLFGYLHG
jgi:hypothetical protein